MGIDINKATVIPISDESGINHFEIFYEELSELAKDNHEDKVKLHFLGEVLNRLETLTKNDLPTNRSKKIEFDFELTVDGKLYTRRLEIVKKLGKSVIYEVRIDLKDMDWYFRATFFPKYYKGDLYYCLVRPFVKILNKPETDKTDEYKELTHDVYKDSQQDAAKYFEISSLKEDSDENI